MPTLVAYRRRSLRHDAVDLSRTCLGPRDHRCSANVMCHREIVPKSSIMERDARRKQIAREAKALVALTLRNGPIEEIHAGRRCPTCAGNAGYSRITDEEMKSIIKNAVDELYTLLVLKIGKPDEYERKIQFGERYTTKWDDPTTPKGREHLL